MRKKVFGINFFETHPTTERIRGIDENHVVVDRKDYEQVLGFFLDNPTLIKEIKNYNVSTLKHTWFTKIIMYIKEKLAH